MRILRHRVVDAALDIDEVAPAYFTRVVARERQGFWLDGGAHAVSGMSYLGTGTPVPTDRVLDDLRDGAMLPSDLPHGVPVGRVGWLRYGHGTPRGSMLEVDRVVAIDHATGTVELLALGESWGGELGRWRETTVAQLTDSTDVGGVPLVPIRRMSERRTSEWRTSDNDYLAQIDACATAIFDGEAYQLCLTNEATVPGRFDAPSVYLALRAASPTHHGGYLRIGGTTLLSASPEQFLTVSTDGMVETRPIKGTRPRSADAAEDARLAAELAADPKERAENLMIVDLMRNDLTRVCEPGSVKVPALLEVESYAQVHQLVSTVTGGLAGGRHPVDAIAACFPAGSMTGAPKQRAMELLDGIERRDRGVYAGAFGWIGRDGSVDLAMTIRSIVLDDRGATIGSGGGITSSSIPAAELAEVKLKAAALLEVLGAGSRVTGPPL